MEWSNKPSGFELVRQTFELEQQPQLDEETLITVLAGRIAEMLDQEPGLLFSTLYRLDVYETKIQQVLQSGIENPALGLARLIIERQKEKIKTRQEFGSSEDL